MHNTSEALLTVDDVAKAFQMPQKTVENLARRGELPALKIGRVWRFRPASIEAWSRDREAARQAFVDVEIVEDDEP